MQTKNNVVIVGAGPAGLSAAEELAKNKNFEVIVLEKNSEPSYKICGGGINPDFIKTNVSKDILDREFNKLCFITPKTEFKLEYDEQIFIGTLNRKKLNEELTKRATESGAKIIFNQNVVKIGEKSLLTANGEEYTFDFLIGADGSNSVVRKHLGLKNEKFLVAFQYMIPGNYNDIEIHIDLKKFGATYAWIFPQKDIISVGTGYAGGKINSPEFTRELRERFDTWCKERFDIKEARFEAFSINYDYKKFDFGNKFLAGDAAGLASGLTGEGMRPAIVSGKEIARKIQNPEYNCKELLSYLKGKKREDAILFAMLNKYYGKAFSRLCVYMLEKPGLRKIILSFL